MSLMALPSYPSTAVEITASFPLGEEGSGSGAQWTPQIPCDLVSCEIQYQQGFQEQNPIDQDGPLIKLNQSLKLGLMRCYAAYSYKPETLPEVFSPPRRHFTNASL